MVMKIGQKILTQDVCSTCIDGCIEVGYPDTGEINISVSNPCSTQVKRLLIL